MLDLDQFTERAAIREFCAGMTRFEAETAAAREQGLDRWQAIKEIREARDAQRGGNPAGVGAGQSALAGQRGSMPVPGMQPAPEEENGPLPFGDAQAGRDRNSLLALQPQRRTEV